MSLLSPTDLHIYSSFTQVLVMVSIQEALDEGEKIKYLPICSFILVSHFTNIGIGLDFFLSCLYLNFYVNH